MDLGDYASYPLPDRVRRAFGAETAGQLAEQLGAKGTLTPELARDAGRAYDSYSRGDVRAAREFLTSRLGLDDAVADDVLEKLSAG